MSRKRSGQRSSRERRLFSQSTRKRLSVERLEERRVLNGSVELLGDLFPGAIPGANIGPLTAVGDSVYFSARVEDLGQELWQSDGSEDGTLNVADIAPEWRDSNPEIVAQLGDLVLVLADAGTGRELWSVDTASRATHQLTDIKPSPSGLYADRISNSFQYREFGDFVTIGGIFLFTAASNDDGSHSVWRSDGTREGTYSIFEDTSEFATPGLLTAVGDEAYFSFHSPGVRRVYRTDGTQEGTFSVAQPYPAEFSTVSNFVGLGEKLLFTVAVRRDYDNDPTTLDDTTELWVSDGTPDSGQYLATIANELSAHRVGFLHVANGSAWFVAGEEIWVSDGTPEGTRSLAPLPVDAVGSISTTHAAGASYLLQNGQIWRWTPTSAESFELVSNPAGPSHLFRSLPVESNGLLYYMISDETYEQHSLWVSTQDWIASTELADLINGDPRALSLTGVGSQVFFRNSIEKEAFFGNAIGNELWTSDGTVAGTSRVRSLPEFPYSSAPFAFASLDGVPHFITEGAGLWSIEPDTQRVAVNEHAFENGPFTFDNGRSSLLGGESTLYLVDQNGDIWVQQQSDSDTLEKIYSFASFGLAENHAVKGDRVYFTARDRIYRVDATGNVDEVFRGSFYSVYSYDALFIRTFDETDIVYFLSQGKLWDVGGRKFPDEGVVTSVVPGFDDLSLIYSSQIGNRAELAAANIDRSFGAKDIRSLTVAGNHLFFVLELDADSGDAELWAVDGTVPLQNRVPRRVKDIRLGVDGANPALLTAIQGRLYFTADDGVHGRELWVSDGTEAGTRMVRDIREGSLGSEPTNITAIKGQVAFVAEDESSGRELWETDGTTAGTKRVADIVPGPVGSFPKSLHWIEDYLYFSAYTPEVGLELFGYDLTEPPDLAVDVINVSGGQNAGVLGAGLNVEWQVTNTGGKPAVIATTDQLWLSLDETLDANDTLIYEGAAETGFPLEPGESVLRSATGQLPLSRNIGPGAYYILAATDVTDVVFEGNETNNTASSAMITLTPPPLPDVLVTSDTSSPSVLSGDTYTASFTVENQGTAPSSPFWVLAWLVTPGTEYPPVSFENVITGSSLRVEPSLSPSGALSYEVDFQLPIYLEGDFELLLTIDHLNEVFETYAGGEGNNSYRRSVAVTQRPLPDLVVDAITLPATAESGGPVEIAWEVENQGNASATRFRDRVVIETLDGSTSIGVADVGFDGELLAGEKVTQTATINLPLFLQGEFRVRIETDWRDQEPESPGAEDNNTAEALLDVTQKPLPDLVVSDVALPAESLSGELVTVSWTVSNGGNADSDEFLQRVHIVSESGETTVVTVGKSFDAVLAVGESVSQTATVRLPDVLSGGFFAFVELDPANGIPELPENEPNNSLQSEGSLAVTQRPLPDLAVTSVTIPQTAVSGSDLAVRWTIENVGNADLEGRFFDRVYLTESGEVTEETRFQLFEFEGVIPAGQSITRVQTLILPLEFEGSLHVVVQTNAIGGPSELGDGSNNTGRTVDPVVVEQAGVANLQVTEVTAPPTAFSGQSITVEWEVYNAGSGETGDGSWIDRVVFSTDQIADDGDVVLGTAANAAALLTNDGYRNTLTATLPSRIEGLYYVLVETNPFGTIEELGETSDNVASSQGIQVQLTPPPDLRVTSVSAPSTAFSGQPATVTWTVVNDGPGDLLSGSWTDRVWLSADDVFDENDTVFSSAGHSAPLAVGESYTGSATGTLPIGMAGEFFFFVETDFSNAIFEGLVEASNVSVDSDSSNVILTPPPDLEVDSFTFPADALAGRTIDVFYEVTNYGATETPNASWTDRIYLSEDDTLDLETDRLVLSRGHFGALEPGEGYSVSTTVDIPRDVVGPYYVFLLTDADDAVFEVDNDNNLFSTTGVLEVTAEWPDLIPTDLTAPNSATAGDSFLVSWSILNQGVADTLAESWVDRLVLSTDDVLDEDDLTLTSAHHEGSLGSGGVAQIENQLVSLPHTLLPGEYFLILVADDTDRVFEAEGESNNVLAASPITISRETSDLQVSALAVDVSASSGITVSWSVTNASPVATNALFWFDNVYLSTDAVLDANDIQLGSVQHSNALAPGESYDAERTFTKPEGLSGNFFVFVRTDATNLVVEGPFDENNTRGTVGQGPGNTTGDVVITPPLRPDLQVEEVLSPASAFSGQPLEVTWQVKNIGEVSANGSWFDTVVLSLDTVLDRESDIYLGFTNSKSALAIGASYTQTAEFELPAELAGEYYVFVTTGTGLSEANRLNNPAFAAEPITIATAPPADFIVGEVLLPANGIPGSNFAIEYTVINQGENAAVGAWTDTVYLSADDRWDLGDKLLGRVAHRDMNLVGGQSYVGMIEAALPGLVPGDYQLIIRSDILNAIPEASETNNIGVSLDRAAIDVATLELDSPVSGVLQQGQALYYKVVIDEPNETLSVDFRALGEAGFTEVYIAKDRVPTRGDFDFASIEPFEASQRALVPSTLPGEYFVLVYANDAPPEGLSYELEAKLLGFEVFDTEYGEGGSGGQRTIAINGANFDRSARVMIGLPDGGVLDSSYQWYDSATKMYATFDLRGLPVGLYDIVVQNNLEESVRIEDALEVVLGGGGDLVLDITAPSAVRNPTNDGNTLVPILVSWSNSGLNDLVLPEVTLFSSETLLLPGTGVESRLGDFYSWLADATYNSPLGVLMPGARGQLRLNVLNDATLADISLRLVESEPPFSDGEANWLSLPSFQHEASTRKIRAEELARGMKLAFGTDAGSYDRALRYAASLTAPQSPLSIPSLMSLAIDRAISYVTPSIRGRFHTTEGAGLFPDEVVLEQQSPDGATIRLPIHADGSFYATQLAPGTYLLSTPGTPLSGSSRSTITLSNSDSGADVDLRAADLSRTLVSVRDLGGLPVAGATILSLSGEELVSVTTTDDFGQASARYSYELDSELVVISPDGELVVISVPTEGETLVELSPLAPATSEVFASGTSDTLLFELASIEARDETTLPDAIKRQSSIRELLGRSREISATSLTVGSPDVAKIRDLYSDEEAKQLQKFFTGAGKHIVQLATDVKNNGVLSALYSSLAGGGGQFGVLASRFASGAGGTVKYSNDSSVASALRDNKVTGENLTTLLDAATAALTPAIQEAAEQLSCEAGQHGSELVFPLETIDGLAERFYFHQGGLGRAHNWDFDGTIVGSADADPRDTRRIRGNVIVSFEKGRATVSLQNIAIEVRDVFDFLPGALGSSDAKQATVPLAHLEIVGIAKEVLIEVDYGVSFLTQRQIAITNPSVEECEITEDTGQSWRIPEIVVREVRSHDPNDITGPVGFGTEKWTAADRALPYLIRFENDPVLANAPAQSVLVTQALDADLDPRTVRFGSVGFGDWIVEADENAAFLNKRVDATETLGVLVDIVAGVDTATGELFWEFTSIDPMTGEPTQDAEAGFLPPNLMAPEGDGFVTYSVSPRRGVQTGTVIDAEATIVFDINEPIITPAIFNTLDVDDPASSVKVLPATQQATTFDVQWSGTDPAGGSGIASFDVYVSENGGPSRLWLERTTLTKAPFAGDPAKRYEFYSVARDNAGNREATPAVADAVTITPGPPPKVVSASIENGDPQRANVNTWSVVFDRPLDLQPMLDDGSLLSAIELTNLGVDAPADADQPVALEASQFRYSVDEESGQATLTWSLDAFAGGASLDDGLYRLAINGDLLLDLAGFSLDGNGDDLPGGLYMTQFHRLAGDLDGDATVGAEDSDAVNAALGATPSSDSWNPAADLDRDGRITVRDRVLAARAMNRSIVPEALTASIISASIPGDFNHDGSVDAADYTVWRDNLGAKSITTQIQGDADGDLDVDTDDYRIWRTNFGRRAEVAQPQVELRDTATPVPAVTTSVVAANPVASFTELQSEAAALKSTQASPAPVISTTISASPSADHYSAESRTFTTVLPVTGRSSDMTFHDYRPEPRRLLQPTRLATKQAIDAAFDDYAPAPDYMTDWAELAIGPRRSRRVSDIDESDETEHGLAIEQGWEEALSQEVDGARTTLRRKWRAQR